MLWNAKKSRVHYDRSDMFEIFQVQMYGDFFEKNMKNVELSENGRIFKNSISYQYTYSFKSSIPTN